RLVGGRARRDARQAGRRRRRAGARRRRRPAADPRPRSGRRRRRRLRPGPPHPLGALPGGDRRMTPEPAPTDRGTWRLVARRDFWVRLRERSFLVSTLINIAVISILVLARASNAATGGPSFDLGYVGSPAIAQGAATLGQDVHPTRVSIDLPAVADASAA